MNKLLWLICVASFAFTGCKKEPEYFFDFDEVIHYNTTMDFDELYFLKNKKNQTTDDAIAIDYLEDRYQTRIDTVTLACLEHIGFTKKIIDKNKYPQLRDVFSDNSIDEWVTTGKIIFQEIIGFTGEMLPREKNLQLQRSVKILAVENTTTPACEWIFRDIFIFKNKGKTIGMAKICFHCGHSHFVGSTANTNYFNHRHFSRLSELLK